MTTWTEGGFGEVRAIDLDGNGTYELVRVLAGGDADRPGVLQVFRAGRAQP